MGRVRVLVGYRVGHLHGLEEIGHRANGSTHASDSPRRSQIRNSAVVILLIVVVFTLIRGRIVRARVVIVVRRVVPRILVIVVRGEIADAEGAALGLDVVFAFGQLDGVAGAIGAALLEGLLADERVERRIVVLEARLGAVGAGTGVVEGFLPLLVSLTRLSPRCVRLPEALGHRPEKPGIGEYSPGHTCSPWPCRDTAPHKCSARRCTTSLVSTTVSIRLVAQRKLQNPGGRE